MKNTAGKKMTQKELNKVIEAHAHWQREDCEGWKNMRADLSGKILDGLNMDYARLNGASLDGASALYVPMACPTYGSFIGWKKVGRNIVKLQILDQSKRSSAAGRKCRCDRAMVLAIENYDGTPSDETSVISGNYAPCEYKIGEIVYADSWDENRWNECSHGIHFFINREEAVNY